MSLRSSARPSPRNHNPIAADPSSSSDFSSPDGLAVVTSPAAAASQRQRRALVRLVGGWWPLPLRSSSTLACLFGLMLLSLVLIDEVATHLRHTHTTPAIRPVGAGPALLHVLRHSFLYRCLLCLAWIGAVLAHGLYVHRGRREKRRRGSSSAASSPMSSSAESSPLLSPATYAGVVKKSVTFVLGTVDRSTSSLGSSISSGGSANDALRALAPNARPSTKKRLVLFFILALLLALCGIAFELYLALVAHGSPHAPAAPAAPSSSSSASSSSLVGGSTLPSSVVNGVGQVLNAFSWSWLLSLLSRALMLLIWLVLFAGACWAAWWRKAIGTRKSGGAAALKRKPLSSIAENAEEEEEEEEWTDDEEDEAEDTETVATEQQQQQQQSEKPDDASASATAAADTTTQPLVPLPPVAPSATMMSPPLLSAAADDDDASAGELSDDSEWEEEADEAAAAANGSGVASFPVPSAAELLLAEKLDASLFYHPEQAQNQYEVGVGGTLRKQRPQTLTIDQQRPPLSGGMRRGNSATNSPLQSNLRSVSATMGRRGSTSSTHPIASFNSNSNGNVRESPVMAPSVSAESSCSLPQLSPPPFTLPLSGGLLNQSTLYHLASTKFIAPLSQADFQNVLPEMQWMQVGAGEDIYTRGQRMQQQQQPRSARRRSSNLSTPDSDVAHSAPEPPSDGMFILVSGTIGALNPSNPDQILSTYHQGDSFGEVEFLFADLPRALTMRALTQVQLLHIPTRLGRLWRASQIAEGEEPEQEAGSDERKSSSSIDDDIESSALTTSSQSTLPFVSALGSDDLRSDILLAFVRTTLARQWRSAQYVLDQYLHVPLSSEFLIAGSTHAMAIQQQQREDSASLSTPAAAAPSRYFSPAFSSFFPASSPLLQSLHMRSANQVELSPGQSLFEEGSYRSDQLFVVLSGTVVLSARESTTRSMELGPGSVLNAVAYLTDSVHSHSCKAGGALTRVGWLSRSELSVPNAEVLRLALLVCEVLAPTLTQYQSLGFERKWIRAGTLVFAESEMCDAVYVIASGRVRVVTGKMKKAAGSKRSKKAAAATDAGASSPPQKKRPASSSSSSALPHPSGLDLSVFTEAHRYSHTQHTAGARIIAKSSAAAASGRVKFELGRGELVGELTFFGDVTRDDESATRSGDAASHSPLRHTATALCVKDAELVKISRGCFENLIRSHPRTLIKLLAIVTKRMRDTMRSGSANSAGAAATAAATSQQNASVLSSVPRSPFLRTPTSSGANSCMSVCLLTSSPAVALSDFALSLSMSLSAHGRTMLLTPAHVDRMLGEGTCSQLNSYVTRAAFAYWLAHVESEYAFCLFVADPAVSPWTRQCIRSGDLTLIVANAHLSEGAEEEEEDEDELEEAELMQRAKRRRHTHRAQRVSKFERMCVWDDDSIAERRMHAAAQPQPAVPSELERVPLGRASSRSPQVDSISMSAAAFSPTLHPSPPPPSHSSSAPSHAHASSLTGHYSRCAPRMHFALRDLVLLHPSSTTMPRGTRWWYACRPNLHRFHHVAVGCAEHTDRLARYIAGKTVGVVLSGGGARGLSHLGVLTSFAEQGVPVDFIGGTSQGSFMSALYASQPFHHPAALAQFALRTHMLAESMGSIRSLLSDATFPMLSYFAGQKFGSHIARILGEHTRIEDLWIPFFLVTTNLSQADMCVHETGRLWKAVRASMTVIDYLPPMQMSRAWPDLLIDGHDHNACRTAKI